MQVGLRELADAVDLLLRSTTQGCSSSPGATAIWNGAKKLQKLTRKTVVDYGTHIKYEAMKSLIVGGADIHRELNDFIASWKLRSPREAGTPYGNLMRKLATIQ